jgi:hypothetical protein
MDVLSSSKSLAAVTELIAGCKRLENISWDVATEFDNIKPVYLY